MKDLMSNSRSLRIDTGQLGHIWSSVPCVYSDTIPKCFSAQWDHPSFSQRSHGLPQTFPLPDRAIINLNQYFLGEPGKECHRSVAYYTFVTESYHITWSQILVPDRSMEIVLTDVLSQIAPSHIVPYPSVWRPLDRIADPV